MVEQEDATYPPSVEECPTTADSVPQKAAVTNSYADRDNAPNFISMISPSYLLQRPQGVHHRLDFLLFIQTQEFVHHRFYKATFPVLEEEVEERESCYDFVFLV